MELPTNPYKSPTAAVSDGELKGDSETWFAPNQKLPDICALCGTSAVAQRGLVLKSTSHEFLGAMGVRSGDGTFVMLPFCHRHRNFRKWWPYSVGAILLPPLVIPMAFAFMFPLWLELALLLAAILLVVAIFVMIWHVRRSMQIYPVRAAGREVLVAGLAPDFVRAVDRLRDAERHRVGDNLARHLEQMP